MAEGEIVGRIAVKVLPDTSEFPGELKRKLTAIEKSLKGMTVEVKADLDDGDLQRDVARAVDAAEKKARHLDISWNPRDIRRMLGQVDRIEHEIERLDDVHLRVSLNENDLLAAKELLEEDIAGVDEIELTVKRDIRGLNEARRHFEELYRDLFGEPQTIKTAVDEESLKETIDEITEQIAQLEGQSEVVLRYTDDEEGLQRLRDRLQAIVDEKREIEFVVDRDDVERQLADIERRLRRKPLEFEVEPNRASIERAQREIDKLLGIDGTFHFKVEQDDPEALRRLREQLEDLKDDFDHTELEFEPKLGTNETVFLSARLAYLARDRWVVYRPILDNKATRAVATGLAALAGGRLFTSTLDNVWDLIKNIDKNLPLIGSITEAVMGLSAALLAASSNTFMLARDLALIAGAAYALPGIFGGLAVGIGASIAVLKDFNQVLPNVALALSDLQDAMSGRFWSVAARPINEAFQGLYNNARRLLTGTSIILGEYFASLATAIRQHIGGSLPRMFENLNSSILIAAQGTEAFAEIIQILGRRGSEYLPRLANWAKRVTENFRDWLDEADRTGKLNEYIETGITNLMALGNVLRHSVGILGDFARAAERAGGSGLSDLERKLRNIREVTSSERFQEGMTRAFRAAHDAMNRISRESGPRVTRFFENFSRLLERSLSAVGDAIGKLIGGIAEALSTEKFSAGFQEFLEGLRDGIAALDDVWTPLGDGIGALLDTMGTMAREFGPILASALELVAAAAERLAPSIERIVEALAGRLDFYLDALGPIALTVADAFARLVAELAAVPGVLEAMVVGFIAFKAAAGLATIVTNLTRFNEALNALSRGPALTLGGRLASLGTGFSGIASSLAGKAGLVGAIAAVTLALQELDNKIRMDRFRDLQTRFPAEQLIRDLHGVADAGWIAGDSLTQFLRDVGLETSYVIPSLVDGVGDGTVSLQEMGRQFRAVADAARGFDIGPIDEQFEELARTYDELIAAMVNDGRLHDATALYQELYGALSSLGYTAAEIKAIFPQATDAFASSAEAAAAAAEEAARYNAEQLGLAEGAMVAAEHVRYYEDALEAVGNVTPQMIGAIREASQAFFDLSEGLGDSYEGLTGYLNGLEQQVAAMEAWADNMAAIARRGVGQGILDQLARLGPEGAPLVADLANASDAEFQRFIDLTTRGMAGAVDGATGELGRLDDEVNAALELARMAAEGKIPAFTATGGGLVGGLVGGVTMGAPMLNQAGVDAVMQYMQGIGINAPQAQGAGQNLAGQAATGAGLANPQFFSQGLGAGGQFNWGLLQNNGAAWGAGNTLAGQAVAGAAAPLGQFGATGSSSGKRFTVGLHGVVPDAASAGSSLASGAARGLSEVGPKATTHGRDGGSGFASGLEAMHNQVQSAAIGFLRALDGAWKVAVRHGERAGEDAGEGFARALRAAHGAVRGAAVSLASGAASGLRSAIGSATSAGSATGSGFVAGLNGMYGAVYSAGARLGAAATAGYRANLQIHSPSRVAIELGHMTAQGLVVGLDDMRRQVEKAGERVGEAARRGMAKPVSRSVPIEQIATSNPEELERGDTIIINGVPMDHAETTAREVLWAKRSIDRGGVYRRRSL